MRAVARAAAGAAAPLYDSLHRGLRKYGVRGLSSGVYGIHCALIAWE